MTAKIATRRIASSSQRHSAAALGLGLEAATQQQRHDQTVADHDGQRHRIDDHHGGGRRKPADEREQRDMLGPAASGSASTKMSASKRLRQAQQAGGRNRHHEQVDQDEIDAETATQRGESRFPSCSRRRSRGIGAAADDAHETQERHGHPRGCHRTPGKDLVTSGLMPARARKNRRSPPNSPNVTKMPTVRKAASLTRDSAATATNQAFLVLGRVDMAGAEQNGERRHRQSDDKRRVVGKVQLAAD